MLSSLHQLDIKEEAVGCLVLCHTRELAYQIRNEFERFSRYLPDIKTKVRPFLPILHAPCTHGPPARPLFLRATCRLGRLGRLLVRDPNPIRAPALTTRRSSMAACP